MIGLVLRGDDLLLIGVVVVFVAAVALAYLALGRGREQVMADHRTDLEQLKGILEQFPSETILEAVRSLALIPEPVEKDRIVRLEQQVASLKTLVAVPNIGQTVPGTTSIGGPSDSASLDDAARAASGRGTAILGLLQRWVTLVEAGEHIQLRIEPITPGLETLSEGEVLMIRKRFDMVNTAIRKGDIVVTPGLSSVRIVNHAPALNALVPGMFTSEALAGLSSGSGITPLATVSGQWFPPGITIDLSPRETDDLIDALLLGSLAAVTNALETFGLTAEIAVPLAIALLAVAGAVKICKELSSTGQVGFKITGIPPMVTPYPV